MKKLFRHGDLLLREVDQIPENLTIQKNKVLALGEATGHHHKFTTGDVTIRVTTEGNKYVEIFVPATLSHEEHHPILVQKGKYELINEREYDYFSEEIKRVQD